ncbi:hypothetical protein FQZ97_599550 [compost metagenome]
MLVVEAVEGQRLPFDEVAFLEGVEGVQLVDLGLAAHAEGQRLGALQVDVEVAAEQAAAQFQADERADVGLRHAQVDVAGLHLEAGADRRQVDLALGAELALLADAGIELEGEGRLVEAVEIAQVEVQRADVHGHRLGRLAVGEVDAVVAQLGVDQQHLPGLAGFRLGGRRLGRGALRWRCRFGG